MLCLCACIQTSGAQQQYILKANEGRMEENLGNYYCTQTGSAELHFVLKLPTIMNVTQDNGIDCDAIAGSSRSELQSCRVARPLLRALHFIKKDATNLTRHELQRIYDIVTSFETENITQSNIMRRGILTSIGSMIGNVFGLATDERVDHITETMKKIYDITYKSASVLDASGAKISKIINAQNDRLDHLSALMLGEHNLTATLFRDFNSVALNLDVTTQIVGQAVRFVAAYVRSLEGINDLKYALHKLISGHLTDELIARETIALEIEALRRDLGGALTVCHLDVGYYYLHAQVKAFRSNGSLVITVLVPFSHYSNKFTAVKVIPVAMPSHLPGNSGYMQLKLDKNILLYSKEHAVYTELESEPNAETAVVNMVGKPFRTLDERSIASCSEAIIFRNVEKQRTLCEFHLMHESTPESQLIRIDARHIFVAGITALVLQCTNQDEYRVEVAAILNADCNCHVRSKNLFLPALSVNYSFARPKLSRVVYTYNSLLLTKLN